ncbi:MAG: methyl-accepting chemotaxis protein [Aliarcobacter sp.]|nr:methyl-accepting chemotaxis protein [Aliarcobacter sp.]
MNYFKELKIRTKLLIITIVPVLTILIYSGFTIKNLLLEKENLSSTHNRISEMEALSKLIHPLQIERGMSVGIVARKDNEGKNKLAEIRKEVDLAIENLKNDSSILSNLSELSSKREQINSLSISSGDTGAYFSKIIVALLDSTTIIPSLTSNIASRNFLQMYTHLATSKESLGQIRANLNGAFTNDKFVGKTYDSYVASYGAYKVNLNKFLTLSTDDLKDFYNKSIENKVVTQTFNMINIAFEKGRDGGFNVNPPFWFENVTATINIFRDIELKLFDSVKQINQKSIDSNNSNFMYMIAFIVILILIISYLTLSIIKDITSSLADFKNGLLEFFDYLNKKTSNISLLKDDAKDEFGEMAKFVNENVKQIEKTLHQDMELIQDAKIVMNRVNNGWYSQFIEKSTSNASLEEFKNDVNEMIKNTRNRFAEVDKVLEEYSKHNYLPKVHMKDSDEKGGVFEKLVVGINTLQISITQMLVENKSNGLTLEKSSNILLSNVDKLNVSSNEAAASLEETAAAIEEITSNIRNNTQNISKMASLSNGVTKSANEGGQLANKTTNAMDEINSQVNLINDAISVIDQIAFQTNILSLNAAVEAATAGEAGRGFAVVAQEVRNLASRSAEAAREIKTIVENAKNKADEGKDIANSMIEGYKNLNVNIQQTINLISDIQNASKEQLLGIEQINDAVNSLDQQTQQNAAVASQTHDVSIVTDKIAKLVVSNANQKEFEGKDSIKAKDFK